MQRIRKNLKKYTQIAPAFTLIELLLVIGLIVFLAGTAVPAIRTLTQINRSNVGARQLIDHLMIARNLAISGRRTVFVIFVPGKIGTNYLRILNYPYPSTQLKQRDILLLTNLVQAQYRGYAFYSPRSAGDQPGRPTPVYLSEWRRLPEGLFFLPAKFEDVGDQIRFNIPNLPDNPTRPLPYLEFPFPSIYGPPTRLPYIAFDRFGRLYYHYIPPQTPSSQLGERIIITRGSIFYQKDDLGRINLTAEPSIVETIRQDAASLAAARTQIYVPWAIGKPEIVAVE